MPVFGAFGGCCVDVVFALFSLYLYGMNILILSRGAGLYSTQSLFRAGVLRGHEMRIVDHARCELLLGGGKPEILYEGRPLKGIQAIIPRIGASVTSYGAAVIRHFEAMGVFTVTRSAALQNARDKQCTLQHLAKAKLPVPRSFLTSQESNLPLLIKLLHGPPVVIKLLESTHGMGVILAENMRTAVSIVRAFQREGIKVMVQEFIREARGEDIRAFVVGGRIVASMRRQAQEGEFRSNLHRGATAIPELLSANERELVLRAAQIVGLDVAGVDFLRSRRGPLLMEVNASPGLEGIENTTGVDIAGQIIRWIERKASVKKAYASAKRKL